MNVLWAAVFSVVSFALGLTLAGYVFERWYKDDLQKKELKIAKLKYEKQELRAEIAKAETEAMTRDEVADYANSKRPILVQ